MDVGEVVVKPLVDFAKDSYRLVNKCTKPDWKGFRTLHPRRLRVSRGAEFKLVFLKTGTGFLLMGLIGFFVKLVFIPINNSAAGRHAARGSQAHLPRRSYLVLTFVPL